MIGANPSLPWRRNFFKFCATKENFQLTSTIKEFKLAARGAYQCTRIYLAD